jgi:hypothetical protein
MTQLELKEHFRDKLIPHYKLAIERCRGKEYREAMIICIKMSVDYGVCWCVESLLKEDITFIIPGYDNFWFKPVWAARATPEILDLLQKRVDKMESIVNS